MATSYATLAGYILAAATSGLALYYFRRSTGLFSLLVEGANRFEEMRQRTALLEQAVGKADERLKQHRDQSSRHEKAVDEAREKVADLTRRVEAKELESRAIAEKLELQKGHLEKMLAKAEARAIAAEGARQAIEAELRAAQQELAAAAQEWALKEKDWRSQSAATKLTVDKGEASTDAAEIKRLKRKIAQYDRLYASMKGLREMTDERNKNWETALRKLSLWILTDSPKSRPGAKPRDIGPLVAQAMTAIGAQLIDENEVEAPRPSGAARAAGMDEALDDDLSLEEAT